jgi:hypothetical protein
VFDSLDQLQMFMAGLAEWLRHWIVALPKNRILPKNLASCPKTPLRSE